MQYDAVTYRLRDVAEELNPQEVSNIMLAAARLAGAVPQLLNELELLAEVLADKVAAMDEQHVGNSIWATAKLQRQTGGAALLAVLPDLLKRAEAVVMNMNQQNVVNIIWAAATLRNTPPEFLLLMPNLVNQATKIIAQIDSQGVANIFWSASKLHREAPSLRDFLPSLAKRAEAVIPEMNAEGAASTILAVGQLPSDSKLFVQNLVSGLTQRMFSILQQSPPREMSNACWGLALCGHADTDFMNSVEEPSLVAAELTGCKQRLVEYDMPQILMSFARLDISGPPDFLDLVSKKLWPMLKGMNAWGLCALSWSCNISRQLDASGSVTTGTARVEEQVATRGFSQQEVEHRCGNFADIPGKEMFKPLLMRKCWAYSAFKDNPWLLINVCHLAITERATSKSQDVFLAGTDCEGAVVLTHGLMFYSDDYVLSNLASRPRHRLARPSDHGNQIQEGQWLCEISLFSQWWHRGTISAQGAALYAHVDAGKFVNLVTENGGYSYAFLRTFGILLTAHVEDLMASDQDTDMVDQERVVELCARAKNFLQISKVVTGELQKSPSWLTERT
ncbi:unnamed protein product [Durusdinium trenchii]|uniref:Uncharacterized protein n=1 Tax=Durusdinium trenchii TaxID=1381693 RepID=A0ABP0KXZ7_9DINO